MNLPANVSFVQYSQGRLVRPRSSKLMFIFVSCTLIPLVFCIEVVRVCTAPRLAWCLPSQQSTPPVPAGCRRPGLTVCRLVSAPRGPSAACPSELSSPHWARLLRVVACRSPGLVPIRLCTLLPCATLLSSTRDSVSGYMVAAVACLIRCPLLPGRG